MSFSGERFILAAAAPFCPMPCSLSQSRFPSPSPPTFSPSFGAFTFTYILNFYVQFNPFHLSVLLPSVGFQGIYQSFFFLPRLP
jgi:hypothetical protein